MFCEFHSISFERDEIMLHLPCAFVTCNEATSCLCNGHCGVTLKTYLEMRLLICTKLSSDANFLILQTGGEFDARPETT